MSTDNFENSDGENTQWERIRRKLGQITSQAKQLEGLCQASEMAIREGAKKKLLTVKGLQINQA